MAILSIRNSFHTPQLWKLFSLIEVNINELIFANRIKQLRLEKGVSAREMSLSLKQSESYINRIETGNMLPSMKMFFSICNYFKITPEYFFKEEEYDASLISAIKKLQSLDENKRKHLLAVIEDM